MHRFLSDEDDVSTPKTVRAQSASGGKFVPGTTWVFDSGGSNNATNNTASGAVLDFLEDFESDLTLTSTDEPNSNSNNRSETSNLTVNDLDTTAKPNLTDDVNTNSNLTLTNNANNSSDSSSTDAFLDEFELEVIQS